MIISLSITLLTLSVLDLPHVDENSSLSIGDIDDNQSLGYMSALESPGLSGAPGGDEATFVTADGATPNDDDFFNIGIDFIIAECKQMINNSPLNSPSAVSASKTSKKTLPKKTLPNAAKPTLKKNTYSNKKDPTCTNKSNKDTVSAATNKSNKDTVSAAFDKMPINPLEHLHPQVRTLNHMDWPQMIEDVYKSWCRRYMKLPDPKGFVNWRKRYISLAIELKSYPKVLNEFFDLSEDEYEKVMKPKKSRSEDSRHKFRAT